MEQDRTCKRCSVVRVNHLTAAYHLAHQDGDQNVLKELRALVLLAKERGYRQGDRLLTSGLEKQDLRELCWNVSSFLQDDEVERQLAHLLKK